MDFLELKPGLDTEKAATDCLKYGVTACVFNSSVSWGFEIQLQPRTEEFYIYSTLNPYPANVENMVSSYQC
jgi:hypothetical protein